MARHACGDLIMSIYHLCDTCENEVAEWTAIPYRGKPADECPDAPRYKALGNSMAVPVMQWIGERIEAVEESMKGVA